MKVSLEEIVNRFKDVFADLGGVFKFGDLERS